MMFREQIKRLLLQITRLKKVNKILGVAASVALLGWAMSALFFSQEDSGTKEAAAELQQLSGNIRRYYQNRPDYWGLSTQMVLDKNVHPHRMLKNNQLIGYFGNVVLVGNGANAEVLMPGSRNFDIIYKNLNKKQCIGLASFRFDEAFWLGVTGITVITAKGQQLFSWNDTANQLPIKPAKAEDICQKDNTIIWHYEQ